MSKERRNRGGYGVLDKDGFIHRSWMKNQGFPDHAIADRPVIGICNNWSELNPCNSGLRKPAAGRRILLWFLTPNRAIVKRSEATDHSPEHEGESHVFEIIGKLKANIDRDNPPVDENTNPVLENCGPKDYPGMPEAGDMPMPAKPVKMGAPDIVRASDTRISGISFGTVVLHVAPEATAGGPLAPVEVGDRIKLSASQCVLELLADAAELDKRRSAWSAPEPHYTRGYAKMHVDLALQADQGAVQHFSVGKDTRRVTREIH